MSDSQLRDHSAIVTGAGGSMGGAIARRLAAAGIRVVATDRDAQALTALTTDIAQAGGQAIAIVGDICDDAFPTQLAQTAMTHFGRLDILINNAGAGSAMVPLWEIEPAVWRQDIALNLTSQFMMCRAVVPHMQAAGYGRIVNVASAAGMEGHALSGGYAAAKAGVIAMTKTLGKELARQGVLVNAIAPALIESRMLQADWFSDEVRTKLLERIPMGRAGKPEEVAEMVLFLSSPHLSFSTGAVFDLSGGRATY